MANAQVEYKRVDLQSYEARNGASLAQSFKYNFKLSVDVSPVGIDAINPVLWAKASLRREPRVSMAMHWT